MKNFFILFTILAWISSCETKDSKTQTNTSEIENKPSVKAPITVEKKILKDTSQADFTLFWKSFRQAVIDNDTAKIIALTQFPLETQGPYDSNPIIKYERKRFPQLLSAYLKEEDYLPGENKPTSYFDQIKKTQSLEFETVQENWARIGNFEFRKIKNRWRLTFAYLSPLTIENLREK